MQDAYTRTYISNILYTHKRTVLYYIVVYLYLCIVENAAAANDDDQINIGTRVHGYTRTYLYYILYYLTRRKDRVFFLTVPTRKKPCTVVDVAGKIYIIMSKEKK